MPATLCFFFWIVLLEVWCTDFLNMASACGCSRLAEHQWRMNSLQLHILYFISIICMFECQVQSAWKQLLQCNNKASENKKKRRNIRIDAKCRIYDRRVFGSGNNLVSSLSLLVWMSGGMQWIVLKAILFGKCSLMSSLCHLLFKSWKLRA